MELDRLTCNTNFWSMYFLAMLGWNSWLSKNRMKNSYTSCKKPTHSFSESWSFPSSRVLYKERERQRTPRTCLLPDQLDGHFSLQHQLYKDRRRRQKDDDTLWLTLEMPMSSFIFIHTQHMANKLLLFMLLWNSTFSPSVDHEPPSIQSSNGMYCY